MFLITGNAFSQCNTSAYFSSQAQIDAFIIANPTCTTLTSVTITGSDITNLDGLSQITTMSSLNISAVPNLTNYSGLNNLSTISENLVISGTTATTITAFPALVSVSGYFQLNSTSNLVSFIGLNNLTSVGGQLSVSSNIMLTALPGMTSLTSVGGNLDLNYNEALVSLSGLNNLASVGGLVSIYDNDVLSSITSLSNLTSINGYLSVQYNYTLTSLSGLQNIDPTDITHLYIVGSNQLSTCNLPNICTYLSNGGGNSISGNANGCVNATQINVSCGVPQSCTNIYLYSQADVDAYPFNYGCSVITGTLYISGAMTNLDGLSQITSVGNLQISSVPSLTNISGLNNLTTITGYLNISSTAVAVWNGMTSLTSIGGNMDIYYTNFTSMPTFTALTTIGGYLSIQSNSALLNLNGLNSLTSVGSYLSIYNNGELLNVDGLSSVTSINDYLAFQYNYKLQSIAGISNIDPESISYLYLNYQSVLEVCDNTAICGYLATGGGSSIYGNAPGCNSFTDIISSCNPNCPVGSVYLYSQADVNAFAVNYPLCTSINGTLYISGSDITDLSPLSNITSVLANLTIYYTPDLPDLDGLENIQSIYGNLEIGYNYLLTDLAGLSGLELVNGSVSVYNNDALTSLVGFESLSTLQNVYVYQNAQLSSLAGLSSLTSATSFSINNNASLSNLNGLQNITTLSSLSISSNSTLNSLAALSNLTTVTSSITISSNAILASLNGLQGLTEVSQLTITDSDALTSLAALSGLTDCDYLNITNNSNLPNLDGLSGLTSVYQIDIEYNDALVNLNGLSNITATTYLYIISNTSLLNLTGLSALSSTSYANISSNTILENLTGLDNLATIYSLELYNNPILNSLTGLEGLTNLNYLYVNNNPLLTSLIGINNISASSLYGLSLQSSTTLSTCNIPAICTYLSNGGSSTITGNAIGCNSSIEVQIDCGGGNACPSGSLTFSNQSEIDAFIIAYPTCTTLGNVTITGSGITNLNGFANIESISNLYIYDTELTSLVGLNNLESVNYLTISTNSELTSISALNSVNVVTDINISSNPSLLNLTGLEGVTTISTFSIQSNPALVSLTGIGNLTSAYNFVISDNGALTSLADFSSFATISYNFSITYNPLLTNLDGLESLTAIYQMQIYGNQTLTSLQGLSGLTNSQYVYVYSNATLTTLQGLHNIDPTTIYYLYVTNSPNLVTCDLENFCTFITNGGSTTINGNATGCNTASDIQMACGDNDFPTYSNISPTTYIGCLDANGSFTISGLIANSVSTIGYTINGGATLTTSVSSDIDGVGTMTIYLYAAYDNLYLNIVSVERTDVTTGILTVTSNNVVLLDLREVTIYYADSDGDGYGVYYNYVNACVPPVGYVTNSTDCNDGDANLYQQTLVYIDSDADGYSAGQTTVCYGATLPPGYSLTSLGTDCDDSNSALYSTFAFYADTDGDGYGAGASTMVCSTNATTPPTGYSVNNTDCSPSVASVYQSQLLYVDVDGDGYDNGNATVCYGATIPVGYSATTSGQDCDDNDSTKHSGYLFYADTDGDGYGAGGTGSVCWNDPVNPPAGYSANNTDCAPVDATKWQSAFLYTDADSDGYDAGSGTICYGATIPVGYSVTTLGADCNDGDAAQQLGFQFYVDADGDGFGVGSLTTTCAVNATTPPAGYSLNNQDCDDANAAINSGVLYYVDNDHDGFGSTNTAYVCAAEAPLGYSPNNLDCNDLNSAVHPGAVEICDGIDNDCDDLVDGDDPDAIGQQTVYADADGDGFGDAAVSQNTCSNIVGYVSNSDDCEDTDATQFPGQVWYVDNDNDGYGTGVTLVQCIKPSNGQLLSNLTSGTGDCDDNNPNISPAAQHFEFSSSPNFTSALISPLSGSLYDTFTFEVTYFDVNNVLPPATFPRVYLDHNANGVFTDVNDRGIIMTPYDASDLNTVDGKKYIASVEGLAYGTNWQTRVQIQRGSCITEIGPFNYPDVLVQPDMQIFANDITFSTNHPSISSPLTVSAQIHNVSDFPAENFYVHLVNQYDPAIVYGDIFVSSLAQQSITIVTWNITTPDVPAWCPMQVIIDYTNTVPESNELNNSAVRPFINGNYNLLGGIDVFNEQTSPQVSYIYPGITTYVTVSGDGAYYGTPTPLIDPSVAGATVTYTIVETGATYSTYTNSLGHFSHAFPAPNTPGVYHITGEMTDFTFTGDFNVTFERLLIIEPCPIDVVVPYYGISIVPNTVLTGPTIPQNTIVEGESISGSIMVLNGCAAVTIDTVLDISQTGGLPVMDDVTVPPLASGANFITTFSDVVFDTPGYYTICGTADGTSLLDEINENNSWCVGITVLPNIPDIHPYDGPSGWEYLCASNNLGFTLRNSGGAATGEFVCDIIVRRNGVEIDVLHQTVANIPPLHYYNFAKSFTYPDIGAYTFELQCDVPLPGGLIAETNEGNNDAIYSVVIYECQADLSLVGCEGFDVQPVDPQNPGMVTYVATIQNSGNALATGPIDVKFELSGGQVYTTQYAGNLIPGESAVVTVNAPSVAPATQTLTAFIDYNNTVSEANETNNSITNSLCWDFQASLGCGLNWIYDYTYLVNQSIYVVLGIEQHRLYDASAVDVNFTVSGPGLSGTIDLGNATVNNLEQTCSCPVVAALPYSFVFPQEGVYTFTMTIDPNNVYTECNEGNNVIVKTVNVTNLPDMRVLSHFINPSLLNPDPDVPITIDVTYENIGTTNLEDTMQLQVLIDEVPLATVTVPGLGTGENNTVAIPVPYSTSVVGAHIIRTIIDSGNVVLEGNELNNEATRAFVVGEAANLHFDMFASSIANPSLGSITYINATIGNNGDLASEGDVMFYYMNDQFELVEIGMLHVNVPSNASVMIQLPWTVLDASTTLYGKIINASVLEFTYDDNEASTVIGGMSVEFISTPACGSGNGTLTALPSGGQAPYSYVWSNGFNGQTLSSSTGNYTVIVTDNTGQTVEGSGAIQSSGPGVAYYADADGDGYGDSSEMIISCEQLAGYVANDADCNDLDSDIRPGAEEIPGNGIDENCNGMADDAVATGQTTMIKANVCGNTLSRIYSTITAQASIANVTMYTFEITDPNNMVQTISSVDNYFQLTDLASYEYNTAYSVRVGVFVNGVWQGYGMACTVSTPNTNIVIPQCGTTLATSSSPVFVTGPSFISAIEIRVTNNLGTQTITRTQSFFNFKMFTSIFNSSASRVNSVEVRVKTTGAYGPWTPMCNITTPAFGAKVAGSAAANFKATAYPNPYTDTFTLNLQSSSEAKVQVKIYDMVGKLLEVRDVAPTNVEAQRLGNGYPSGVYNVIVTQQGITESIKVIKR